MWKDETEKEAQQRNMMKSTSSKKSFVDELKEFITQLNAAPKPFKIFAIVCIVFIIAVIQAEFGTDYMPSEADRMRNRIADLQKDMREKANLVGYEQYSSGQSARQAKQAVVNGFSNPMGPSEDDRKNYREGVDEIRYKDEISTELIAQIAADQAEIERIEEGLAEGVYKEK